MVMLAYYKNKSITKNELLKVIEKSYLTSNVYIDTAIKKGYFRIIRNEKDKRSIFILPSVITIKTFEEFIDRRDILYKGVKWRIFKSARLISSVAVFFRQGTFHFIYGSFCTST